MDELESWFEDAVKEWSKGNKKAADDAGPGKNHPNRRWAMGDSEHDTLTRMLKLAGVKSEAAGKAKPVNRNSGSWWSGDIDGSKFAINKAASQVDDFSAGGTVDPKPSFGDVEGISKPTPNVDTFSSKFHKSPDWKNVDVTPKKVRKNTDPDR